MRFLTVLILSLTQISVFGSTITLTPTDDVSVRSGITYVNENANWLETFASNTVPRYTYIKFNVSEHEDDVIADDILSAKLRLYVQTVLRAGEATVLAPLESWNEIDITGNNFPTSWNTGILFPPEVDIVKSDKGGYIEIDITNEAKQWFDTFNGGIAVLPTDDNLRVRFGSQRIRNKGPEVVMELIGDTAMSYEPFSKTEADEERLSSTELSTYTPFQTMVKTEFKSAQIIVGRDSNFSGTVGVAIYTEAYGGVYGIGPDELIAEGQQSYDNWDIDNLSADSMILSIDFDESVTLRPGIRYWFAQSIDLTSGQVTYLHNVIADEGFPGASNDHRFSSIYFNSTNGWPDPATPGSAWTQSTLQGWFRINPYILEY